jgi:hypothetical protein
MLNDLREGIFTTAFFVLGRKPLKETEIVKGNL